MYLINTLNLSDIKTFLDKYHTKTPFIKSYELDQSNDSLTISLLNDAKIRFAQSGTKQMTMWPNGSSITTQNDVYHVLAFQSKLILQNSGVFMYGNDITSSAQNTYFIADGRCFRCNQASDFEAQASDYQLVNNALPLDNVFNGQTVQVFVCPDVFVQSTTFKLSALANVSETLYNGVVNFSEQAIMSKEGADLYYLFKLPKAAGYVDGWWRYYMIVDDDGYQN